FYYSAIILGQNSDHNPKYTSRNHNLTAEGNIFRPTPRYRAKSAVVVSNVTGAIVRNNFIDSTYGEDKPGERCLPGGGIHVTPLAVGTKIYGNVLVNIKEPKAALLIRADCEIYNNTVVGCARALEIIEGVKAVVKNNIFYKNAKQMGVAEPMGQFYEKYFRKLAKDGVMGEVTADLSKKNVFDYNLWFPDWKGKGPHAISADPGFVGPVKPLVIKPASPKYVPNFERMKAYRLKKSSPCIDKGVKVGLPIAGKASDIGAFEFGRKKPQKTKETTKTAEVKDD
ncbi:MAG: right-handed parallel beta-helix repeat-containing protein, partial [Phycisphaerae bacterium]|nr:right-handed parallel beta-helix repeat-containing protein [Phycisphaerae bacterium]